SDAVTARLFQHGRQCLKNLLTTLTGFRALARAGLLLQRRIGNFSLGYFGQWAQNFRYGHKAGKSTGKSIHSRTEHSGSNRLSDQENQKLLLTEYELYFHSLVIRTLP